MNLIQKNVRSSKYHWYLEQFRAPTVVKADPSCRVDKKRATGKSWRQRQMQNKRTRLQQKYDQLIVIRVLQNICAWVQYHTPFLPLKSVIGAFSHTHIQTHTVSEKCLQILRWKPAVPAALDTGTSCYICFFFFFLAIYIYIYVSSWRWGTHTDTQVFYTSLCFVLWNWCLRQKQ